MYEALDARCAGAPVAPTPAGIRKPLCRARPNGLEICILVSLKTVARIEEASPFQETRATNGFEVRQHPGTELHAASRPVRLVQDAGPVLECSIAETNAVTRIQTEAGREFRCGNNARHTVRPGGERGIPIKRGSEFEVAVEGIGSVYPFHLHQRALACRFFRGRQHPSKGDDTGNHAEAFQEGRFLLVGEAMDEANLDVATEQIPRRERESLRDRRQGGADACNRCHAEGQADHKDGKCFAPSAQFRACDSEGRTEPHWSVTSLPPCRRMIRSVLAASSGSCVTRTRVASRFVAASNSRSATALHVDSSRLPVGSSARMRLGEVATALAMATRCCSPPESSPG